MGSRSSRGLVSGADGVVGAQVGEASWLIPLQVGRSQAKARGCLEKWLTKGPAQGDTSLPTDICPPGRASKIKEMIPVGSVVSAT